MTHRTDTLERELAAARDPHTRLTALNELSTALLITDPARARVLAEDAVQLALTTGADDHAVGLGLAYCTLAELAYEQAIFSEAVSRAYRAFTLFERTDYRPGMLHALSLLGRANWGIGNSADALEHLMQALELAEQLQDTNAIAQALVDIGGIPLTEGRYAEAREHYDRAAVHECTGVPQLWQARLHNNRAIALLELGELDAALEDAQRALSIFKQWRYDRGVAIGSCTVGDVYLARGCVADAQQALEASRILARKNNWPRTQTNTALILGRIHQDAGEWELAVVEHTRALAIADQHQHRAGCIEAHRRLATSYKALGDFERAYTHLEQYHMLKDALHNEKNVARQRNLEAMYQIRTAEQEAEYHQRRATELERIYAQDRQYLERLNEMKDHLINTTSHDLKNPIAAIQVALYLLEKEELVTDPRALEYLSEIESQIRLMHQLIVDTLDLAKLETGRAITMTPASIGAVIQQVVDEFTIVARERGIALAVSAIAPDLVLNFDTLQIRRVLGNLISNAIKYTPPGGSVVVDFRRASDAVIVSVSDNGIGIPADDIPYVFDRFFRASNRDGMNATGSGLGLAIARTIVEQHDGVITVNSQLGQGTTFRFTLPLAPAEYLTLD